MSGEEKYNNKAVESLNTLTQDEYNYLLINGGTPKDILETGAEADNSHQISVALDGGIRLHSIAGKHFLESPADFNEARSFIEAAANNKPAEKPVVARDSGSFFAFGSKL
jgi:hypothetical protein